MSQVRTELSTSGSTNLGRSDVRSLAGVSSGKISMSQLRGKSKGNVATLVTASLGGMFSPIGYQDGSHMTPGGGSLSPLAFSGVTIYALTSGAGYDGTFFLDMVTSGAFPWTTITIGGVTATLVLTMIEGDYFYETAAINLRLAAGTSYTVAFS